MAINICEFGCKREATHQLKNGKWCCCKSHRNCPDIARRIGIKNSRPMKSSIKIETKELCDYGCGQEANFQISNGKLCCKSLYIICPKIIEKRVNKVLNTSFQKPILIENKNKDLCNYCNIRIAKYKLRNGKLCCESSHPKCPSVKDKNRSNQNIELIRNRMLGDKNPMKIFEIAKKVSISNTGKFVNNETKLKMSVCRLGDKNHFYGKHHTKETKLILSEKIKNKYKDEEFLINYSKSLIKKPNKPETILIKLLNEIIPNKFEYVGDYSLWIDGKNPDFINKTEKKIIEFFGDYWHGSKVKGKSNKEHEIETINHFKENGYSTLIIWETEMSNMKNIVGKILKFERS